MSVKGIIFDMDNTLLRSRIDFAAMKKETFQFLVTHRILSDTLELEKHTTSTIIEKAIKTNKMTSELLAEMWEIPKKHEMLGMQGADLEPGVIDLLNQLHNRFCMVVITNNSIVAAEEALKENGIFDYFESVIGREMMTAIKPSPDAFLSVLDKYNHIPACDWISVGDAWIDGRASIDAGIRFISYQADTEKMKGMGVIPHAEVVAIGELLEFLD